MAFEIAPLGDTDQIYQIRAIWEYDSVSGGESSWSFWSDRGTGLTKSELYAAWATAVGPMFVAKRPQRFRLVEVRVEDRWPGTSAPMVVAFPFYPDDHTDLHGLPPQVTPIVSWRTPHEGRSYRGRTYWGPCVREDCEEQNVMGDTSDNVYAWALKMLEVFGNFGSFGLAIFCIVSRMHDGVAITPGTWTAVSHFEFNFQWATQRRRQGVWRNFPY